MYSNAESGSATVGWEMGRSLFLEIVGSWQYPFFSDLDWNMKSWLNFGSRICVKTWGLWPHAINNIWQRNEWHHFFNSVAFLHSVWTVLSKAFFFWSFSWSMWKSSVFLNDARIWFKSCFHFSIKLEKSEGNRKFPSLIRKSRDFLVAALHLASVLFALSTPLTYSLTNLALLTFSSCPCCWKYSQAWYKNFLRYSDFEWNDCCWSCSNCEIVQK